MKKAKRQSIHVAIRPPKRCTVGISPEKIGVPVNPMKQACGNTRRMAECIAQGAERIRGVRVSLYDLEGGESDIFTDLVEEADGLAFGSPTINADAVKPIWDLLSSLTTVNVKGKLGAAFGSYGWSGEAVRLGGMFRDINAAGQRMLALVNDLLDLPNDRAHRIKRNRPLASGAIGITTAVGLGAGSPGAKGRVRRSEGRCAGTLTTSTPTSTAVPTTVPTAPARTEPTPMGTKIFRKPRISTWRSMPKMLPTMIAAMNR